jgi:hypothetical protein
LLTDAVETVSREPVCWEMLDDRGEVAAAGMLAHQVVDRGGFAAVIGHFNSLGAELALPVYRAAGLPVVLPLATAPGLGDGMADTVLRVCPDDDDQVTAIAQHCRDRGLRRLAVVHDGSGYGRRLADRFPVLAAAELSVRLYDRCWPDEHCAGTAFVVCGVHHQAAELLRCRPPWADGPLVVLDDCDVPEFATLAGPAANGALVTRLPGGPYPRILGAVTALAAALARDPARRGGALLAAVADELPVEFRSPADGWRLAPLRSRRGTHDPTVACDPVTTEA